MNSYYKPKQVEIVYFSGTGGTKRAADLLAAELASRNILVHSHELHIKNLYIHQNSDILILLYPVYAMNAPKPIYDFIQQLPQSSRGLAAVISISGGGEVLINTASRLHTIRRLRAKGYRIPYENMLVMPSNCITETPEELSLLLMQALPKKVASIAEDFTKGVVRRTKPYLFDQVLSDLSELEKQGARMFGKFMKVKENCNSCGLCAKSCPMGNISLQERVPTFGYNCTICLRCVYQCPKKAIRPILIKQFMFENGYQLDRLEKKLSEPEQLERLSKIDLGSYPFPSAFLGIKKYLLDEDKP